MTTSALKKATVETLSIAHRKDGKSEIVLKITADQRRMIDCAAAFISAGVGGLELLDVFSQIFPTDTRLRLEPTKVSPNVHPFHRERTMRGAGPIDVSNVSEMNAPQTASNDDRVTEASNALDLLSIGHERLLRHNTSLLLELLELMRDHDRVLRDHDHMARNNIQTLLSSAQKRV